MLFQLPQSANTQILKDHGIYVDELKRVDQAKLEQWMFQGTPEIGELNIPDAYTHTGLSPSMLLKWIANYGLALADVDADEYKDVTDELDRRISVMKDAHFDYLFPRNPENHSTLVIGSFTPNSLIFTPATLSFDFGVVDDKWSMTVWDDITGNKNTINIHEY